MNNTTIAVTGASHGIGAELSHALVSKGAGLVINARGEEALLSVQGQLEERGAVIKAVIGDASDDTVAREMAGACASLGNFRGFVHCAGVLRPGQYLWEMSKDHFMEVMDASLTGAFQMVKRLVPELKKHGSGFAVFFGSGAADLQAPGIAAYCIAKAAEESLAMQLATEAQEIASFVFRPGMVETRMHEQARNAQGGAGGRVSSQFKAYKRMGYLAEPADVAAGLADFLDQDLTNYSGKIVSWSDISRVD